MNRRYVGVDPYIEKQCWHGFHTGLIVTIHEQLMPRLLPKYIALIEENVYLETNPADDRHRLRPDVSIARERAESFSAEGGVQTLIKPELRTLPMTEEVKERYLAIYTRENRELVTVIELLSPTNKRPNSDGRREYLAKRQQIIQTKVNLVEIDLLLEGERMPTVEPLPKGDFYVFVARGNRRPIVEVYAWTLEKPLPTVPIPLLPEDPDVLLNLQEAYEQTFQRGRYDVILKYDTE